ncbi:MAG: MotA/TolQ/ExbB proton channel family protein [Chromatiales bacterium]
MHSLFEYYEHFLKFLDRGGPVIILIIVASVLMWGLIIERYWFLYMNFPRKVKAATGVWGARSERSSWYALRIREQLVAELSVSLQRNLLLVKALVTVLPLLGLLGTVSGMITSFEVLRVFGTDNARGLTAGIAEALFTTLTGLLTALSGLYFSLHLQSRARRERQHAADLLALDAGPGGYH